MKRGDHIVDANKKVGQPMTNAQERTRVLCWFSCGATSAVASKLICSTQQKHSVVIAYTQVNEESGDNIRFLNDCAGWFGRDITILRNEKYGGSIYQVFEQTQYLVSRYGAPCTKKLKRDVREQFQLPDDIHVLGFSAEEQDRADEFAERNPSLALRFPLIDRNLTKADCLALVQDAGIKLPDLYLKGYDHNNCIGCVKGGMGYWNKIRVDFPSVFIRMAETERKIGHSINRSKGLPVFLDELDPSAGHGVKEPSIECGVFCESAKLEMGAQP